MSITTLGVLCVALLAVSSLVAGRRGARFAIAAMLPFYDSAAVVIAGFGVSPYYAALLVLVPLAVALRLAERDRPVKVSGLLVTFWLVAVLVTVFGPAFFAGQPVFESNNGLDQQVGHLAALGYSSSNAAQVIYLTLNLLFVVSFRRPLGFDRTFIYVALASGVVVATCAYLAPTLGYAWPQAIFDNVANNRFGYTIETGRLRAQFSEPSHLGIFASAGLVLFGVTAIIGASTALRRTVCAALAGVSGLLVLDSATGTALGGLAVGVPLLVVVGVARIMAANPKVPPASMLAAVGLAGVATVYLPQFWTFTQEIVAAKQRGPSLGVRLAADQHAIDLLQTTWGLGVGLGGNRTSSMMTLLLSTIGIVGTGLFLAICVVALRRALRAPDALPEACCMLVVLVAAFISDPSFQSGLLWGLIAVTFSTPVVEVVQAGAVNSTTQTASAARPALRT